MALDGGGSNLEVALGGGLTDSGTRWRGSNLEVALGGGDLPDSGTRWRGI